MPCRTHLVVVCAFVILPFNDAPCVTLVFFFRGMLSHISAGDRKTCWPGAVVAREQVQRREAQFVIERVEMEEETTEKRKQRCKKKAMAKPVPGALASTKKKTERW